MTPAFKYTLVSKLVFFRKIRRFIPTCETAQDDGFSSLIVNTEFRNNRYTDVHWNSMTFSSKDLRGKMAILITFVPSDSDDTKLQYVQLLITATDKIITDLQLLAR